MTTTDLTPKFEQLKLAFAAIDSNRKLWQDETRARLTKTLEKIKSESGLELHVQKLDDITNSEGINITFGVGYSGMYTRTSNSMKSYMKRGGYIVFSQAYNGQIFVIIGYPHIEELVSQAPSKLVGKFNPQDITEEFIYEAVGLFLDEMIVWETAVSIDSEIEGEGVPNPVGFVYGKQGVQAS